MALVSAVRMRMSVPTPNWNWIDFVAYQQCTAMVIEIRVASRSIRAQQSRARCDSRNAGATNHRHCSACIELGQQRNRGASPLATGAYLYVNVARPCVWVWVWRIAVGSGQFIRLLQQRQGAAPKYRALPQPRLISLLTTTNSPTLLQKPYTTITRPHMANR
jgi:hypothetical protein